MHAISGIGEHLQPCSIFTQNWNTERDWHHLHPELINYALQQIDSGGGQHILRVPLAVMHRYKSPLVNQPSVIRFHN